MEQLNIPALVTVKEAVDYLQVDRSTVWRMRRSGRLPTVGTYTSPGGKAVPLLSGEDVERLRRNSARLAA